MILDKQGSTQMLCFSLLKHLKVRLNLKILVQTYNSTQIRPRNCLTSFGVLGGSIFWILSNFSGSGVIPFPETICPKYCICFFKKLHLTSLSFKSAFLNFSNKLLKCSRWVSISGLYTRISSKYPKAKVSPDKTSFTNL